MKIFLTKINENTEEYELRDIAYTYMSYENKNDWKYYGREMKRMGWIESNEQSLILPEK